MNLVTTNKITVKYGSHTVLRDVSINVKAGEIVTIVGPNGSGKTSLVDVSERKTCQWIFKFKKGREVIFLNV